MSNVITLGASLRLARRTPAPMRPRTIVIEWIKQQGMTAAAERIVDDSERIVKLGALLREMREGLGITDASVPIHLSAAVAGKLEYALAIAEGTAK